MIADRYVKAMLTITALATSVLAVRSVSDTVPVTHAQAAKRCVWTYIVDAYKPDIGKDGEVAMKGKNWQRVSVEGWRMVGVVPGGYLFERCD